MSWFEVPTCPNCSQPVNSKGLRREFFRRRSIFDEATYGLECDCCHQVLKLRKWRSYAFALVLYVLLIWSGVVVLRSVSPRDHDLQTILLIACMVPCVIL